MKNNEKATGCWCRGCEKKDCTCAGMKGAEERAACDGSENCAQSGCTYYTAKHRSNKPTPTVEEQTSTATKIVMLPIDRLHPHPDNPRKDIGDVSELAESIKANGVLQNLTVVPNMVVGEITGETWQRGYKVIIGHRRLAAAKLAGLTLLPCVIADMSEKEQLSTMLTENMQRADLTVYEQAQGFQLMLDLGSSVDEIANDTGFSQSTIRRRVKLLDLDKEKFKKSVERGATLMDYAKLDQIEDPALKNEVLEKIGTNNFESALRNAVQTEKTRKQLAEWLKVISTFAKEISRPTYAPNGSVATYNGESIRVAYIRAYGYWNKNAEIIIPAETETLRYFYVFSPDRQIDLYREVAEETDSENEAETPEEKAKRLRKEDYDRRKSMLRDKARQHFELRKAFVKNFGSARSYAKEIVLFVARSIATDMPFDIENNLFTEITGLEIHTEAFATSTEQYPEYALLAAAYSALDCEQRYFREDWDMETREYKIVYNQNERVDEVYGLLESIGYELSDEEKAMRDGTHELFKEVKWCEACEYFDDYGTDGEGECSLDQHTTWYGCPACEQFKNK